MTGRNRIAVVVLAALVALSGCSALGGGTTPTAEGETTTADETPTGGTATTEAPSGESPTADTPTATGTPTRTPTPTRTATPEHELTPVDRTPSGDQSLPPGVKRDGSVNETALLAAHFEAANESGWALTHRNGDRTTRVVTTGETTYARTERGVAWTRGNVTVSNRTFDGTLRTSFERNTSLGGKSTARTAVVFALAVRTGSAEYEWAGTRTVNGTTLHELVMTGVKGVGTSVGYYTGRVLVDERGRIHRLAGAVGENRSVADEYVFDFSYPVASVPKPRWFEEVPRLSAATVDGGHALAVTVTGGPALPGGAELTFSHNRTRRTVTLDASLAPGETLYLALESGDDPTLVQSRERPSGSNRIDLDGAQTRLRGEVTIDGVAISVSVRVGELSI